MFTTTRTLTTVLFIAAAAIAGLIATGPDEHAEGRSDERAASAFTRITLQLPFWHSGAFAGYYAADQQGGYAEEGLAVDFRVGGNAIDPVLSVLEGKAEIGIANASHLLKARSEGRPVRAIAAIHQLNPVMFVALEASGITHPKQFAGKTIRSSAANLPILRAVTQRFGVTPDQYNVVHKYEFSQFSKGEIDILAGFHFWTKNRLEKAGLKGRYMYPDNYGIHLYRDCIFTTDDFIAERPDVIAGFLRATLKRGWISAVREPEAAGPLIVKYAPKANVAYETEFLMAMLPLINTGEVPIGWMKPEVWAEMAETLEQIGCLDRPVDAADVYTMRFLEDIDLGGVGS